MKYKLIATDMDGTLLNSENKISNRNTKALHKAIEKGIYVVLSTGRILNSALYYAKAIELNNPIVACNGAIVSCKDGNNILYEKTINIDTSKKIVKFAEEHDIYYHFYSQDTFYSKEMNESVLKFYESFEESFKKQQLSLKILDNPTEILNKERPEVYKFIFIEDDADKLLNFREKLNSIGDINISSSWSNNIEVMSKGVSKGNGLKYLCDTLNIDNSQIVAIGDNENDISMLEIAGLSVAMGNGDKIIREYSDVITDTNDEDGVAKAIEKYVLNI